MTEEYDEFRVNPKEIAIGAKIFLEATGIEYDKEAFEYYYTLVYNRVEEAIRESYERIEEERKEREPAIIEEKTRTLKEMLELLKVEKFGSEEE